jgi:O-antigen/teichoic acid export membrane protein
VIRDRLVYKTALSLVTIATSGAIRLIFSVLVGRVFGAPLLGHVNVIVSTAVFATLLCSPGLGQSVARQMATRGLDAEQSAGRSLLAWATAWHHAVCLAVAVVTAVLVPADGWGERAIALALTFGYGCYTFYKAVLYGVDLVRQYAALELAWDVLFLAALVTVVVTGARPWVLAPMALVYLGFAAGAHLVLFARSTPGDAPPRERATDLRHGLLAFAAVTTVGTASSAGFLQLSQLFAARAEAGHGSGLFAAAMTLVTPAYLLPRAMSVVLFPAMARAAGRQDRDSVRRQLTIGTQVLAAGLLPLFALVAMVATPLLSGIYGGSFAGGAPVLVVMIWATWVSIASVPAVNALSSDPGRAYLVPAAASVAGFLVGLALWLSVGTSITMVAWGYLAGSLVQSAVPMVEAWRRHSGPGPWTALRMVAMATAGLLVALQLTSRSTATQVLAGVVAAVVAAAVMAPELRALARFRRVDPVG